MEWDHSFLKLHDLMAHFRFMSSKVYFSLPLFMLWRRISRLLFHSIIPFPFHFLCFKDSRNSLLFSRSLLRCVSHCNGKLTKEPQSKLDQMILDQIHHRNPGLVLKQRLFETCHLETQGGPKILSQV